MKLISKISFALILAPLCHLSVIEPSLAQGAYDSAAFNKSKTSLKVLRVTPHGEDVPANNRQIVFKFNQPVVPLGDMKRSQEEIPIEITPKVDCQWLWLDTSSLSCQLTRENQLIQSSKYSIIVKSGITTVDGVGMQSEHRHTFITQRPKLEYMSLFNWLNERRPVASLTFNQAVKKSSVEAYVQFKSIDGQVIPVIAERAANPLTDSHYRQANSDSEFIHLKSMPLGNTEETKAAALKLAKSERGGAHDEARMVWNIAPAVDLPPNTNIDMSILAGLSSIVGSQTGVENTNVHRFKSLPAAEFLGVNCKIAGANNRSTIEPI